MSDPSFLIELAKMVLALIVVIGLMYGLSIVMRKLNSGQFHNNNNGHTIVTPIRQIDSRRRLVEVQWRNSKTLLLLGPQQDIVVAQEQDAGNNQSHE